VGLREAIGAGPFPLAESRRREGLAQPSWINVAFGWNRFGSDATSAVASS